MSGNNLEVWKDIPGFEEKYQVSTMGRVRSLPRETSVTNFNGTTFTVKKDGAMLTPQKDKCGYVHVRLVKDGRYVLYKVHQLVGLVFLGYNRKNIEGLVLDHVNGIKSDNRLENLEIVTKKENSQRYWRSIKSEITRQRMRKPKNKKKNSLI